MVLLGGILTDIFEITGEKKSYNIYYSVSVSLNDIHMSKMIQISSKFNYSTVI